MRIMLFLLLAMWSCQQQPSTPAATDTTTPAPLPAPDAPGADTVIGVAGSERSRLVQENQEFVYRYARYTVRVAPYADEPGEKIAVAQGNAAPAAIDVPEAGYFAGLSGDFLFIDVGTGPNGRQLHVIDLRKNLPVYSAEYTGEADVRDGKLHLFIPVEEKQAQPKPDCPEKGEWLKNGLGVGYAQRAIYDLQAAKTRVVQEFTCFAMQ